MNIPVFPTPTADIPALFAPAAGASVEASAPLFAWTEVPGATSYRLQVAADPAFTHLFADVTVSQTALTLLGLLPEKGTCHGRVQALGRATGAWSEPVTFATASEDAGVSRPTVALRKAETSPLPPSMPLTAPDLPPYLYSTTNTSVLVGATAVMIIGVLLTALALLFGMPQI
jgi:hypothetical protein